MAYSSSVICRCTIQFDERLIDYIRYGRRNAEAKLMLNKNMVHLTCPFCGSTLLHIAAHWRNEEITEYLLDLGSDVDGLDKLGRTALMKAMNSSAELVVRVLLKAGASIDIADAEDNTALTMALGFTGCNLVDFEIIKVLYDREKMVSSTTEDLLERLFKAGCNLHHIVLTKNIDMVKILQGRAGFNVDSRNEFYQQTSLHIAADINDFEMVELLISYGADASALDVHTLTPIYFAVRNINLAMVQFLLDHGADPDPDVRSIDESPLFTIFTISGDDEGIRRCVELLLQHGAYPAGLLIFIEESLQYYPMVVQRARGVDCIIAHLAMFSMVGTLAEEWIMPTEEDTQNVFATFLELKEYYDMCLQILKRKIFRKMTLFDLLKGSELKIRPCVRNGAIVFKVQRFCSKPALINLYPYYCNTLKKRISEISHALKLENEAIGIVCDLLNGNYNQLHVFARQVVSYLTKKDLEQLCQVPM